MPFPTAVKTGLDAAYDAMVANNWDVRPMAQRKFTIASGVFAGTWEVTAVLELRPDGRRMLHLDIVER